MEIKIENAMQFVFQPLTLVNWKNRRGIKGEENVEAFLQELQAIKPLTEAEIIELIESDAAYVEGAIGNSRIYSAMETDDRLVVMWYVITFNHRPYAISAGENMKETYYVLPEKMGESVVRRKVMATIHFIVGLPCSGKTTFAKKLEKSEKALLLSPDDWQIRIFDNNLYGFSEAENIQHSLYHDRIEAIMWMWRYA
ncbi:MAG: AAA family ATPase [Christensenellaceae bacterium]